LSNRGIVIKSGIFEDCHITLWVVLGNSNLPSERYKLLISNNGSTLQFNSFNETLQESLNWLIFQKKKLAHKPTEQDDSCASFWEITFNCQDPAYNIEIQACIASDNAKIHKKNKLANNLLAQIIMQACSDFFDIVITQQNKTSIEANQI